MKQKEQEQKTEQEVKDKTFGKLSGKIISETLTFESQYGFSFDFKGEKSIHRFSVNDRRIVTKMCQLYGVSYKTISRDLRHIGKSGKDLIYEIQEKIKSIIKKNDRSVVLLTDDKLEPVSIVSEQHQQLPLSRAFEIVNSVALKKGAKLVTSRDTGQSYLVEYEVNRNRDMSIRVRAYLGRNDAMGRAGITFEGGGNIFVCSNTIIPHVDRDIQFKSKDLLHIKIVHTQNIEKRLEENLIKSFDAAKHNITVLSKALTESKKIKMSRVLQKHCVELIRLKHDLPDKWNFQILRQLEKEDESLYGLSQALTYVGTNIASEDSTISKTLQKIGGQVVLLGKDFTKLIETSIKKRGLEVPKLVASN